MSHDLLSAPGQTGPDEEFPATLGGGHALVVEYGDEELIGRCQCGEPLGTLRPGQLGDFAKPWDSHVTEGWR